MASRRQFLKTYAAVGTGFLLPAVDELQPILAAGLPPTVPVDDTDLYALSLDLLKQWCDGVVKMQIKDYAGTPGYGGIFCPACSCVHGRSGDLILPLLFMANYSGNARYTRAAMDLYTWMEANVSETDGSWVNEINISDWKGITVFGTISLAESLLHFGHLLPQKKTQEWKARLNKAASYVLDTFTIDTGNINYPMTATYALALCGTYLKRNDLLQRAAQLAGQCKAWFTPKDRFIFGEGKPDPVVSEKGCYSVDLGYNVEESLPALWNYCRLVKDEDLKKLVVQSMKTHLEFMLPDGGWDNSWGTRNFKWTYWGSRTSDGCQSAFGVQATGYPEFYRAALLNTQLLKRCTKNGFLHGGPHNAAQGITPCLNHGIGHAKALALLLLYADRSKKPDREETLPREGKNSMRHYPEIDTWLIKKGNWNATVTAYDQEYSFRNGHTSGGALSMLWHQRTGPVLTAGMNAYQMIEAFNMQRNRGHNGLPLTPRFEVQKDGQSWMSCSWLKATVQHEVKITEDVLTVHTALSNGNQELLAGNSQCALRYTFSEAAFKLNASSGHTGRELRFWLPLICGLDDKWVLGHSGQLIITRKTGAKIILTADAPVHMEPGGRPFFNQVPGLAALPVYFETNYLNVDLQIV